MTWGHPVRTTSVACILSMSGPGVSRLLKQILVQGFSVSLSGLTPGSIVTDLVFTFTLVVGSTDTRQCATSPEVWE